MDKRFVLLKHENKVDFHVDFLLDCGGDRLLTWQFSDKLFANLLVADENFFDFTKSPNRINSTVDSNCRRIFDHRRKYLNFSGDLGDHRGYITRIECGTWELLNLSARQLVIKTVGTRLADNAPVTRLWQFEPPIEIAVDTPVATPDWLMQQLPPPGDGNWVVSCSFLC